MANDTTPPARPIDDLWRERCAIFVAYAADDRTFSDQVMDTSYWNRIDGTEVAILAHPDTSPRAAEIRLWVAWWHTDVTHREAIAQGDVAALLPIRIDLDWHEKLIFAAILNLRGETL